MKYSPLDAELKVLALRKERDEEVAKLKNKYDILLHKAESKLSRYKCSHPPQAWNTIQWTWDNGNGQSKKMQGLLCTLCNFQKLWLNSELWVDPKDISND